MAIRKLIILKNPNHLLPDKYRLDAVTDAKPGEEVLLDFALDDAELERKIDSISGRRVTVFSRLGITTNRPGCEVEYGL